MLDTENDILGTEDATLLLYLADELDVDARTRLEGRLASDPSLRNRLADLASVDEVLSASTANQSINVADSRRALSNSLRLVREQALLLQSRPVPRTRHRLGGVPRWAWGTAVAASVAVGTLVWITNSDPPTMQASTTKTPADDRTQFLEAREMGMAFLPIRAEGNEAQTSDIESEVDALNVLAVMSDPPEAEGPDNQ